MHITDRTARHAGRIRHHGKKPRGSLGLRLLVAAIITCGIALSVHAGTPVRSMAAAVVPETHASPARTPHTPFYLEKNVGQAPHGIQYLAHAGSQTLAITDRGAVLAVAGRSLIRMTPLGGSSHPYLVPMDRRPGIINYFIGKDPRNWHTNIPTYGQVTYRNVYPGVDLRFHGQGERLEYDWVVKPGGDAARIRLAVSGGAPPAIDAHGALHLGNLPFLQTRPTIYQQLGGTRHLVQGGYVLTRDHTVRFQVGYYDQKRTLVIDPVLLSSQRIGGAGDDFIQGIQVDKKGNIYIDGSSDSPDFGMIKNAFQRSNHGGRDLYVMKLRSNGSLLYGTYIGGADKERAFGLAIDGAGRAYVGGSTASTDFPKSDYGGPGAVAVSLNPQGNALHYSIVTNADRTNAVAVDGQGNAYFAADTTNDTFVMKVTPNGHTSLSTPIPSAFGAGVAVTKTGTVVLVGSTSTPNMQMVRAVQPTFGGGTDAFILGLNAQLNQIRFFTYLGGTKYDEANAVTVGGSGNIFVAGDTESTDFPAKLVVDVTQNVSPFVAKFSSDGSKLLYNTVIGSIPYTEPDTIAVNKRGTVAIGGYVEGAGLYPTSALRGGDTYAGGDADAFLSALDVPGQQVTFSSYLGGSGGEGVHGLAFGGSGNLFVGVNTTSPNFPRTRGPQSGAAGKEDGFLVKIGGLR